jgi:hypothetical protein
MTESEAQDFVTRYASVWEAGIRDDFRAVWHGDGTQLDRALKGRDIPAIHRMQKAAARTLVWTLAGWTSHEDVVGVEWRCSAERAGGPFRGVDKFHLPDGKIIEETVFSGTAPLHAAGRGEALKPMMRFPAIGGRPDQEG